MQWEVEYTDQFEAWWMTLSVEQQRHIAQGVELVAEHCPNTVRASADRLSTQ